MRLVFDHCVPRPLARYLADHEVVTAAQLGWSELANGKLLAAVDEAGFDALITLDRGFANQQNMEGRRISVYLIGSGDTRLAALIPLIPSLLAALQEFQPGKLIVLRQE